RGAAGQRQHQQGSLRARRGSALPAAWPALRWGVRRGSDPGAPWAREGRGGCRPGGLLRALQRARGPTRCGIPRPGPLLEVVTMRNWPEVTLRSVMAVLWLGVLGCCVALEQRALIGPGIAAFWLVRALITPALRLTAVRKSSKPGTPEH